MRGGTGRGCCDGVGRGGESGPEGGSLETTPDSDSGLNPSPAEIPREAVVRIAEDRDEDPLSRRAPCALQQGSGKAGRPPPQTTRCAATSSEQWGGDHTGTRAGRNLSLTSQLTILFYVNHAPSINTKLRNLRFLSPIQTFYEPPHFPVPVSDFNLSGSSHEDRAYEASGPVPSICIHSLSLSSLNATG